MTGSDATCATRIGKQSENWRYVMGLMKVIAETLGVDPLDLYEEAWLSEQQRIMIKMVRVELLGQLRKEDPLPEGGFAKDIAGAVARMETHTLIAFERNVPALLRGLDNSIKVFEAAAAQARAQLEDIAGLPEDDDDSATMGSGEH
jgi:hypothetical protein